MSNFKQFEKGTETYLRPAGMQSWSVIVRWPNGMTVKHATYRSYAKANAVKELLELAIPKN
jgi:hypothetical protein